MIWTIPPQVYQWTGVAVFSVGALVAVGATILGGGMLAWALFEVGVEKLLKATRLFARVVRMSALVYAEDRRRKAGRLTEAEAMREEYDRVYGWLVTRTEQALPMLTSGGVCVLCGPIGLETHCWSEADGVRHQTACPIVAMAGSVESIRTLTKRAVSTMAEPPRG